jgi:hypothetical protein
VGTLARRDDSWSETPGAAEGARIFFPEERAGAFNQLLRDHLLAT